MRRDLAVLGVSGAAMVVATNLTFTVAVLAPFLLADDVVSVATLGAIPAAYYLAASSLSGPAGIVADRIGGRRAIIAMCVANATALLALAISPGLLVMVAAALLGGSAMALSNPATNLVIVSSFGPGRRGAALGWKQAGVPVSGVVAGVVLPTLAAGLGWRGATLTAIVAPVVCAVAAGLVLPRVAGSARDDSARGKVHLGSLAGFAFLMGVAAGALNTYLVVFLVSDAGLSPTAGGLVAAAFAASAAASRVGWATLVDRLGGGRRVLLGLAVTSSLTVALLPFASTTWSIWPTAVLAGAAVLGWQAVAQLAVVTVLPLGLVGAGSAALMRWFFAGLLSGPLLFGAFLGASDSYAATFVALSGSTVVAALLVALRPPAIDTRARRRWSLRNESTVIT